jgi:hypothetical protein
MPDLRKMEVSETFSSQKAPGVKRAFVGCKGVIDEEIP